MDPLTVGTAVQDPGYLLSAKASTKGATRRVDHTPETREALA
jgi:hypothetical protein